MKYNRGDIIELPFTIPGRSGVHPHPALILSGKDAYHLDACYVCVMLTHSIREDIFSFPISDGMLTRSLSGPPSQVRCHLITYATEDHVITNSHRSSMKKTYVDLLVRMINDCVLCEDA
ncbi:MAG: type II toxin-antitoxin system PemK/MazF family toxin [Flavobacteriales bacterium]